MLLRSLAALLHVLALASAAQAAETTWQRNAGWLEQQIESCADGSSPGNCRAFPARALDRLFGLTDLCSQASCVSPAELAAVITKGPGWSAIGQATDQSVLSQAQQMAVGGMPVVAVNGSTGWVVLVMPGKLYPSERWRRNVPASVGTRLDQPAASVYGKGLNFLFSDPSKVTLYVHK
jgi:hypothetical protein